MFHGFCVDPSSLEKIMHEQEGGVGRAATMCTVAFSSLSNFAHAHTAIENLRTCPYGIISIWLTITSIGQCKYYYYATDLIYSEC